MDDEGYLDGLHSSERKLVWEAIAVWNIKEQIISPLKLDVLLDNESNPELIYVVKEGEESSDEREESNMLPPNPVQVILN